MAGAVGLKISGFDMKSVEYFFDFSHRTSIGDSKQNKIVCGTKREQLTLFLCVDDMQRQTSLLIY